MAAKKHEKRHPGAFTTIPGRFLKASFGAFRPQRRYEKTRMKTQTSRTRGDKRKRNKTTRLTLTRQHQGNSRCCSCRNPAASTRPPAPTSHRAVAICFCSAKLRIWHRRHRSGGGWHCMWFAHQKLCGHLIPEQQYRETGHDMISEL